MIVLSSSSREQEHEEGANRRVMSISEFIKQYSDILNIPIDEKQNSILTSFAKRSQLLSNLSEIDRIDEKNERFTTNNIEEDNKKDILIPCHHCGYQGNSENEVLVHSINCHPNVPARPDDSLLKLIKNQDNAESSNNDNNIDSKLYKHDIKP